MPPLPLKCDALLTHGMLRHKRFHCFRWRKQSQLGGTCRQKAEADARRKALEARLIEEEVERQVCRWLVLLAFMSNLQPCSALVIASVQTNPGATSGSLRALLFMRSRNEFTS